MQMPQIRTCLSGNDALLLLEVIRECLSAETERSIREKVFPGIQKLFPFDFGGAWLGATKGAGGGITITDFFDISLPLEFCREYDREGCLLADPVVVRNFKTYEIQYWSFNPLRYCLPQSGWQIKADSSGKLPSLLTDFGMNSGYSHGCASSAGGESGSYCSFLGSSVKYDPRVVGILEHLTPHLHLALLRAANQQRKCTCDTILSVREQQVLNWLKEGKSSWEISVVLGVSERTINFHVYNLMGKLGALNRPQAVAIAIRHGLIPLG
jgi:DNA-binding CsgD family transcriptional regulator